MVEQLFCSYCGKEIKTKRSKKQLELHKHFFCSKECERNYIIKNRKPNVICTVCGKPYRVKPFQIPTTKYCSNKCKYEAMKTYMKGSGNHQYGLRGELNASWQGGTRHSSYGYILIKKPEHPFANGDGCVFEHRLIAEKFLLNNENSVEVDGKRYLSEKYCVHHIDFDRQNNSVDNLIVMSKKEHSSMHSKLRSYESERVKYKEKFGIDISERFIKEDESKIG